jgi:hypothetical protein
MTAYMPKGGMYATQRQRRELEARGVTKSRRVLRGVKNPRDFDGVLFNLVHRNIGQRREGQLAPLAHAATGSPQVGKIPQRGPAV